MPANLQGYKVNRGDPNLSPPFDKLITEVEAALNAIGSNLTAYAGGQVLDPAQIKQGAASNGQVLTWTGAAYTPTTPAPTTANIITDTTLKSDQPSFDLAAIPGTYKHLLLLGALRSDRDSREDDLGVRFNADSGPNYDAYTLEEVDSGPTRTGHEFRAENSARQGNAMCGNQIPNVFSSLQIWIPHYAGSVNNKSFHALYARKHGTAAGDLSTLSGAGFWRSNAAVTQITLNSMQGSNLKAGSHITLYGY